MSMGIGEGHSGDSRACPNSNLGVDELLWGGEKELRGAGSVSILNRVVHIQPQWVRRGGMGALRRLESQNDHTTSKHRKITGMGLFDTCLRRLLMTAWVRCKAFLNIQRTRRRIRMDGPQGSNAVSMRARELAHTFRDEPLTVSCAAATAPKSELAHISRPPLRDAPRLLCDKLKNL